ncbi:MAG: FapA family protein [Oscillospiraceae bacterium]
MKFNKWKKPERESIVPDEAPDTSTAPAEVNESAQTPEPSVPQNVVPEELPVSERPYPPMPIAILAQKLGLADSISDRVEDFFLFSDEPTYEEAVFFFLINDNAQVLLDKIYSAERDIAAAPDTPPFSSDMHLQIYLSPSLMSAYGFIFPPIGTGAVLTSEHLKASVRASGIVFGENEQLLDKLAEEKTVMKVFPIAKGLEARDGIDGKVIELFDREKKFNITENENQTVDYKNLGWVQTLHGGDKICDLILPVPSENGMNIKGLSFKGKTGIMPHIPSGKNTVESEDHLALVAECDGQLIFKNGTFRVEQTFQIDGDVDNSVGNLDIIGSVTIKGDVPEGFTIKATVDITVIGIVEGANLIAGGNIKLYHGMNGNYKGKLEAGGNVASKYIENAFVKAGGIVSADSIVNCTVVSSDRVVVTSGKGIIVRSSITAFNGIDARVVGNERNLVTNLTAGTDPVLVDELRVLKKDIEDLTTKLDRLEKDIAYIEKAQAPDPKYQQLLSQLRLDHSVAKLNLAKKEKRTASISERLQENKGQIVISQINPTVNITIGNAKTSITKDENMCRIYALEGQIIIGKK